MSTAEKSFEIREGRPGEGGRILPCYEWLFTPPGELPPNWIPEEALVRLENLLASDEATIFLAESTTEQGDSQAKPIGICSVYIDIESVRFGLRAWIEDLAVSAEHRSAGIGAELMRAARQWSRERGATHVELDSGMRRHDAHRFYDRLDPAWTSKQYAWQL